MSRFTHYFQSHKLTGIAAILVVAGAASAYGVYMAGNASAKPEAPASQNGVMPVGVQTVNKQKVRLWSEFSGRLRAVDFVEVRPEVSGRITEIRFDDGQLVNAGDVLIVIDPRPYEAAVAKAEANYASAQTNAQFAKTELTRAVDLLKTHAIPQRIYDERANANRVAQAAIQSALAELKQAKLNLEYAYVKAPISGRISRAEITVGNLVQTGSSAPVLTTIVSNEGIYADFEVDEQTYLQSIRAFANNSEEERAIPVELTVQGDKEHTYPGTIYSFDNHIDTASGTIRARAKFPNENGELMPGMFVSIKMANGGDNMAFLVPEHAVNADQNKHFVYVVGKDNKVAYREVNLGKQVRDQRIIQTGLNAGDRVIVEGVQQVRPDMVVAPKEIAAVTTGAAAPAGKAIALQE